MWGAAAGGKAALSTPGLDGRVSALVTAAAAITKSKAVEVRATIALSRAAATITDGAPADSAPAPISLTLLATPSFPPDHVHLSRSLVPALLPVWLPVSSLRAPTVFAPSTPLTLISCAARAQFFLSPAALELKSPVTERLITAFTAMLFTAAPVSKDPKVWRRRRWWRRRRRQWRRLWRRQRSSSGGGSGGGSGGCRASRRHAMSASDTVWPSCLLPVFDCGSVRWFYLRRSVCMSVCG